MARLSAAALWSRAGIRGHPDERKALGAERSYKRSQQHIRLQQGNVMTSYGSSSATSGSRTNGLAIASLVVGIIGIFLFPVILGPVAIVLGAVGMRQARVKGGGGMAKAGVILGVVDLVIFAVMLAVVASNGGSTWYVGG